MFSALQVCKLVTGSFLSQAGQVVVDLQRWSSSLKLSDLNKACKSKMGSPVNLYKVKPHVCTTVPVNSLPRPLSSL